MIELEELIEKLFFRRTVMDDKLQIDVYYPDEINGSDKFEIILNLKNISDHRIIIKDIREALVPGRIIYCDKSSTHLDLDDLAFYRKSIYDEMWRQVIDANRVLIRKESPISYFMSKLFNYMDAKLSYFAIYQHMNFEDFYKECFPNEFYRISFYLTNSEQVKTLKQDYIDKLDDTNEIKKAFYRNEEELNRVNIKIKELEEKYKRKYGKVIESNQYIKVPIKILCEDKWKYSKESLVINVTFEDEIGEMSTISEEMELNIKPSKKTVFFGAILGVIVMMLLTRNIDNIDFIRDKGFRTDILINIFLAILMSLLTYDNSQKIPIKAEGIYGGFLIGVISVIGKEKLLEVFTMLVNN